MMFLGLAEDAFVTIQADTFVDAKAFALVELGASDDRPVLVSRIADTLTADVELRWCGTDAGVTGGRWMQVYRRGYGKQSKWRAVDADRAWWDRVQRTEKRQPEGLPPAQDAAPRSHQFFEEDFTGVPRAPIESTRFTDFMREIEAEARSEGPEAVAELEALRAHHREAIRMADNLTATQKRSGELLEEARFARRETAAWVTCVRRILGLDPERSGLEAAISAVMDERGRQDAKWGPVGARNAPQNSLSIPFGTGLPGSKDLADEARASCDAAFKRGDGTWADVLKEEVAEALAETDPENLRRELIQIAAVCVKLIEILDWKGDH